LATSDAHFIGGYSGSCSAVEDGANHCGSGRHLADEIIHHRRNLSEMSCHCCGLQFGQKRFGTWRRVISFGMGSVFSLTAQLSPWWVCRGRRVVGTRREHRESVGLGIRLLNGWCDETGCHFRNIASQSYTTPKGPQT